MTAQSHRAGFTFVHVQGLTFLLMATLVAIRAQFAPLEVLVVVPLLLFAMTAGPVIAWLAGLGVWYWDRDTFGFVELDPVKNWLAIRVTPWFDMVAAIAFAYMTIRIRIP